jgi:hypothetical protein
VPHGKEVWSPEKNVTDHTHERASSGAGDGSNGIFECKILSKPEHRTAMKLREDSVANALAIIVLEQPFVDVT